MDEQQSVPAIQEALAKAARVGVYRDAGLLRDGIKVGADPERHANVAEVEALVTTLDEPLRERIQARLGLGKYQKDTMSARNDAFARLHGARSYGSLSRAVQTYPLRILATLLAAQSTRRADEKDPEPGAYDSWDVLEYEAAMTLPPPSGGSGITSHRRVIRSRVDGLREFRVTQATNWPSGNMPEYRLTSVGKLRLERIRPFKALDLPGYRFDLVITIPELRAGEELELAWVRTYPFEPGDLYVKDDVNTVDLTPIVTVSRAKMSVRFDAGQLPSAVWRFEHVPALDRLEMAPNRTPLNTADGRFSATFDAPQTGYSYGIGWVW